MNEPEFTLNDRFIIDPSLGSVNDLQIKQETRIEPRLMNLLCLLVKHEGKLVGRALITKEIWDDYGNADEGLTQAISYLRKVLADENKIMIETVPKKGYILRAKVTVKTPGAVVNLIPPPNRKKLLLLGGLVFILLIMGYLIFRSVHQENPTDQDKVQQGQNVNGSGAGNKAGNPNALPDSSKKQPTSSDSKQ